MGEVIRFDRSASTDVSSGTDFNERKGEFAYRVTNTDTSGQQQRRLELDDIYPSPDQFRIELVAARPLLREFGRLLEDALENMHSGDRILADELSARAQLLLPELFCCRSIGDGFGAIVLGLFHSMQNMRGMPLNLAQLTVLRDLGLGLLEEPYVSFEVSLSMIDRLSTNGFDPDPERIGNIQDALDSDDQSE